MNKHNSKQAFLITNKSNIRYLSNFTGSSGFILLTKTQKYLFTDFRYLLRAKNTIKKNIKIIDITKLWRNEEELIKNWYKILKKHNVKKLGVEESNLTIEKYKKFKKISQGIKGIKFLNISGKIEDLREIKSEQEIKLIKKSQQINEKVFNMIKKIVQKFCLSGKAQSPITEIDLAWKIKELGHKFHADDVSFNPIVAFGKNTAIVHHSPTNKKLKKGDIILIDMGMKYKGFCSDMTRMIFTAPKTKKQKLIYNLVLKAQIHAIKNIKSNLTCKKADKLARNIIEKAGYGEFFGHAGGHGIGLDIHENPSLSENSKDKIKNNSIITVEPGIYLPNEFGVRIEDMLLIKNKKTINLTKVDK